MAGSCSSGRFGMEGSSGHQRFVQNKPITHISSASCVAPRSGLGGSSEMFPITNVTATIDEGHYRDSARLIRVLQSHRTKKTGHLYLVKGTFDQIDDLSLQLSAALKHEAGPDSGQPTVDLTVLHLPAPLRDKRELQRRFPQLLFESRGDGPELTVTGPAAHVAMFKKFLRQQLPRCADQTTFSPSSANGRQHQEESCPICLESIDAAKKTALACKHSFCTECLERAFDHKPVCPTCGKVYGVLRGTQPEGGRMAVSRSDSSLPGYEQHGTIIINYSIPGGIQQEEHPSPGEPYSGASRRAYLPDSPEGRRVLMLLRKAFDQRLIFTVGQSTSTSRNNTVTWNDIHHKTSVHGGPTHYGYPDPDYLRRVEEELAAKGVQ